MISNQKKQEAYEKLIAMSRNDDYTIGNLLDFLYYQSYYKIIGLDLARQTNINIPQKINFWRKLEDDGAKMVFITEKQQKAIVKFSLNLLIVPE